MSAHQHPLVIDDTSSTESLLLAAEMLDQCTGVVMLNDMIALHPTAIAIMCEVIDPTPNAHRCAEEFKVLVENAERNLFKSKLADLLPQKPLNWVVISDDEINVINKSNMP